MSSITNNSPFVNTLMIWKALFLKDALARFFGSRGAWAWLLIEPVAHILGMAFIYALIKKCNFFAMNILCNIDIFVLIVKKPLYPL